MKHINWKLTGKSIMITALICVVTIVAVCALVAGIIGKEIMRIEAGGGVIYGAVLLTTFIGAWVAAKKAPCERLLVAVLTAAVIPVVMLFVRMVLLQEASPLEPWKIFVAVSTSVPAGLLASGKKGRRR